jgi:hypothetical protein
VRDALARIQVLAGDVPVRDLPAVTGRDPRWLAPRAAALDAFDQQLGDRRWRRWRLGDVDDAGQVVIADVVVRVEILLVEIS